MTTAGSGAGPEPLEVEVKLGVERPGLVRRLLAAADPGRLAGFAAAGELHMVTLTDRYLDTDRWEGRLAQRLVRARLRRTGATIRLTVKRAGVETGGVTTRVELDGPATQSLDPRRWPDSHARTVLIDAAAGAPLREIARLRQRRLTRLLRRGETRVELSLDALAAVAEGAVVARRYELEAELVTGEEAALAELANALRAMDGVGPPLGSKLGFALGAALVR